MPDEPFTIDADEPGFGDPSEDTVEPDVGIFLESPLPIITLANDGEGYVGFGIAVAITWHSGLGCSDKAGGPESGKVFWRVKAPSSWKIVTFVATRIGAPPTAPHIDLGDNEVLMASVISAPDRKDLPDGSIEYSIAGERVYAMQKAADAATTPIVIPNSVLRLGGLTQLYPEQFSRLLIDPTYVAGFTGGKITF